MRVLRILLVAVTGLILGYAAGGFLSFQRASRLFQNVPASPIVVGSLYDREQHRLEYLVLNPGAVPLTVVRHSLVFTPGQATQEQAYRLMNVPSQVPLPPFSVARVLLNLKAETEELRPGDVVAITLHYTHPFSPDEYAVFHTTVITEEFLQQGEGRATPAPNATPTPTQ